MHSLGVINAVNAKNASPVARGANAKLSAPPVRAQEADEVDAAIDAVLAHFLPDELDDWRNNGRPDNHIVLHLLTLKGSRL
jgi:hypothetical protein